MTKKLTALVGFHERGYLVLASNLIQMHGYNVESVTNPDKMIALAKEREFNAYHWDINFGNPGSIDISFSENFWPLIKSRYELGHIKALAATRTEKARDIALAKGIPCLDKDEIFNSGFYYFKIK